MKMRFCVVVVGLLVLFGSAVPGVAMMPGGGGFHGGSPGGFHVGMHDGHFPQNSHTAVHNRVFIGAPFFVGGPFWWGPGPYYTGSPVVVQSAPPTYIQQVPAPAYWYYCPSSQSY